MTYVITEPCVGTLDAACAEACPVECIHPAPGEEGHDRATILYVDPEACIDCSACMEVCPVGAPLADEDVPAHLAPFAAINRAYYENGLDAAEGMLLDHLRRAS